MDAKAKQRYSVTLYKPVMDYLTMTLEVDAEDEEQAQSIAVEAAENDADAFDGKWTFSHCGDYDGAQTISAGGSVDLVIDGEVMP